MSVIDWQKYFQDPDFFFFNYMKCWFSCHHLELCKKNDISAFFCGLCVWSFFSILLLP